MITKYRELFNTQFTGQKYQEFKDDITSDFNYAPTFRLGETPFFISKELKAQLVEGCNQVISFIQKENFKRLTDKSLELNHKVPNEDEHTSFLAIDFGICEEDGAVIPKLIEVQGFPSLYNYQVNLYDKFKNHYPFLKNLTPFINDIETPEYLTILEEVICNKHPKESVILLEIEPEKQNTKIDFYYCKRDIGIPIVCVTELIKKGKQLFYKNEVGDEILVKRIYNRVIFDELDLRTDLKLNFNFSDDLDVEWAGHPNWFFRISKFILPFLKGKYFIETTLLSELKQIPEDLENYVLKPLFSFSGTGVIFHVKKEDIEAVTEKELYILQKKVNYLPIVQSPDGKVKAEVRILCVWKKEDKSPTLLCNLVRLSRGEMIGVKFNKDKDWVGGTLGLFER
ncbi:MAG TPA: hypothetical protein PLV47_04645 [Flavobacterium sp.]|jgi:hypothetical protein|uniref:hypothetical protein n=1 Tax=Flavobacterium sp. TaxID=239 RepID=UPI001B5C62F7|nr:hypothetical protein [Flavobacterium sp.]MBP7183709.1 hypothetical protein [Flavobacterium sp.]MBP7318847.1 hypothetical protein [Flavobacterium sp.]HRL71386.1 hypothetical protein [Flavobacterium sp.]HRM12244.1 hypothetical protein [Flavobacterium sp.]HRM46894.1 hypothetical protein [Flavobacterium sp.]